jgi:hypothetical protein
MVHIIFVDTVDTVEIKEPHPINIYEEMMKMIKENAKREAKWF